MGSRIVVNEHDTHSVACMRNEGYDWGECDRTWAGIEFICKRPSACRYKPWAGAISPPSFAMEGTPVTFELTTTLTDSAQYSFAAACDGSSTPTYGIEVDAAYSFAGISISGTTVTVSPVIALANNGTTNQHGKIVEFKVTRTAGNSGSEYTVKSIVKI